MPRKTTKYQFEWSYKRWKGTNDINDSGTSKQTGCEKVPSWAKHNGPKIFQKLLDTIESEPSSFASTEEFPEFIPWRLSKNLPIYNETTFY